MEAVGTDLRLHRRIVWATTLLVLIGAVALYSATTDTRFDAVFFKQAPLYLAGILVFVGARKLSPTRLFALSRPLFWVALGLMVILALPLSGKEVNRSINLIFFQLQAWEVYKLALVLYVGRLMWGIHRGQIKPQAGGTHLFVVTAIGIFLLAVQPDLDAIGFLVVATALLVLYSGAFPLRMAFGLMSVMAAASIVLLIGGFYMVRPSKGEQAFHHDTQTKQHIEYAVVRGGVVGVGWADSRERYVIPAVQTDMIAGHITESVGVVGFVLLAALYLVFIFAGIEVASRHPGYWQRLAALGIVLIFANQVLVNLLIAFQVSPVVAGIPLPFMSGGGSAVMMNLTEAGILARLGLEVDRAG
jgi:cell division protein FtsW